MTCFESSLQVYRAKFYYAKDDESNDEWEYFVGDSFPKVAQVMDDFENGGGSLLLKVEWCGFARMEDNKDSW